MSSPTPGNPRRAMKVAGALRRLFRTPGTLAFLIAISVIPGNSAARGADEVSLRESWARGESSRVVVLLEADGKIRVAPAEGAGATKDAAPVEAALAVRSRLDYLERVLELDEQGRPGRAARVVREASASIRGAAPLKASNVALPGERALLVALRRERGTEVLSPSGPLSRNELDLVQQPGDPFELWGLLPEKAVKVGDTWTVSAGAARSLTGYEALAVNGLVATLKSVDAAKARIGLAGRVEGAVLGSDGAMNLNGNVVFDRKIGRVVEMTIERGESRKPGPVEAGLDVRSTLKYARTAAGPAEVAQLDGATGSLPAQPQPEWASLRFRSPDGTFTFLHDRDWHVVVDDARQVVLKRLDALAVVAQMNLVRAPQAKPGEHLPLDRFRADLQTALGARFGKILAERQLSAGVEEGGFRYRIAVEGKQGDDPIVWYYYLVSSPGGDQVVAAFTLRQAEVPRLGDADLRLVGSLEWVRSAAQAR